MEITEQNKRIAEFMGFQWDSNANMAFDPNETWVGASYHSDFLFSYNVHTDLNKAFEVMDRICEVMAETCRRVISFGYGSDFYERGKEKEFHASIDFANAIDGTSETVIFVEAETCKQAIYMAIIAAIDHIEKGGKDD